MSVQSVGQILLFYKMSVVVMGVFILCAVSQIFHQGCGSVAQMQGHRQVAGISDFGQSLVYGQICRIALRARSEERRVGKECRL